MDNGTASVGESLINIVQDASENYSHTQRNIRALQELHSKHGEVVNKWIEVCIAKLLTTKIGVRNAEGALRFIDAYLKKECNGSKKKIKDLEALHNKLVSESIIALCPGIDDQEKTVRYRSCQIIALMLNQLEELDEEVYQTLKAQLTTRIKDKDSDVRVQAVISLSRLQDSGNSIENKDVTMSMINVMQYDPSPFVRRSALWNMDVNKKTLPYIVEMASDTDQQVRCSVFKKLNKEVTDYNLLTVSQRECLLYKGLSDRSREVIKNTIKLLLEAWGKGHKNISELLTNLLDVSNSNAASLVVKSLVEAGFETNINYDDHMMTANEAYVLGVIWDHYDKHKNIDALETLLPPVDRNIECIEYWYNAMLESKNLKHEEFAFEQMLELAKKQDFSEESIRTATIELLEKILANGKFLDSHKIYTIMQLLHIVYSNVESWSNMAFEMLKFPCEMSQDYIIKLFCVDHSYDTTPQAPTGLRETFDNTTTFVSDLLTKRFDIIMALFRIIDSDDLQIKNLKKVVDHILINILYPALKSQNLSIYILGLNALATYAISTRDLFVEHLALFKTPSFSHIEIVHLAIKILTDGFILYGKNPIPTLKDILNDLLMIALSSSNDDTLILGAESTAKLFLYKRFSDENLIRKLVLLYLLSKDSGQTELYECLSQFFFLFVSQSHENKLQIQKIFVPVIDDLNTCVDDEPPNEVIQYITSCAKIIIKFLLAPISERLFFELILYI